MNDPENKWLDRMLDAALDENTVSAAPPDFDSIRAAAQTGASSLHSGFLNHRTIKIAAIAAATAAAAIPAGILGYQAFIRNKAVREENSRLAEELIGGTIFDEDFLIDDPWPADIAEPGESFDI